jgi:hypothetical protein
MGPICQPLLHFFHPIPPIHLPFSVLPPLYLGCGATTRGRRAMRGDSWARKATAGMGGGPGESSERRVEKAPIRWVAVRGSAPRWPTSLLPHHRALHPSPSCPLTRKRVVSPPLIPSSLSEAPEDSGKAAEIGAGGRRRGLPSCRPIVALFPGFFLCTATCGSHGGENSARGRRRRSSS